MENRRIDLLWFLVVLFLVWCLVGCAPSRAGVGPEPSAKFIVKRSIAALDNWLYDPESAQYKEWDEPVEAWRYGAFYFPLGSGWAWSVRLNARNAFGGYTGYSRFWFFFDERRRLYFWETTAPPLRRFPDAE